MRLAQHGWQSLRRLRRPRPRLYDLVFYTPWIGSILSTNQPLPPGGAERQVLMLAKELAARGVRVAIIVFGTASRLPSEYEGVRIVVRPPYRKRNWFVGLEPVRIWQSLWRVPSPTIVFRTAGFELAVLGAYARAAGRRLVYSSANVVDFNPEQLFTSRIKVLFYELGVRLADAIVVQTEEQIGLCEAAFRRRPALIKSIAALAPPQLQAPEAFLWIGRLNDYKRPLEYIALAQAVPEARFWMIGVPIPQSKQGRELAEAVTAQAAKVSNLELLAPRSQPEVEKLMSRAVASVNTADFEGMPNVLLEAWSRGVPALALTHDPGGVISQHGLGGFADGSFERLIALAREQWTTRGDREPVSLRCRAYIERHHGAETITRQWLDVLTCLATQPDVPMSVPELEPSCAA